MLFNLVATGLLAMTFAAGAAESAPRSLRVAFFYKSAGPEDDALLKATTNLLNESVGVDVEALPYHDSNQFCELYRQKIRGSNQPFDLILGPSDSDSLKALDKAVPEKQTVPFVAPFVTTMPEDYNHIKLISAAPTDTRRVSVAVSEFVQYTALRSLACLHTDDPWGSGIARNLRTAMTSTKVMVLSQPVIESAQTETNGIAVHQDNTKLYQSFLDMSRRQGATVIAIALLSNESLNEFFAALKAINDNSLVDFKPSILLLNPPTFDPVNRAAGILVEYVKCFSLFYVEEHVVAGVPPAEKGIAPHRDVCQVIAAAARIWPPSPDSTAESEAARNVRAFYLGSWPTDRVEALKPAITTGFHRAKLHFTDPDVQVLEAVGLRDNTVGTKAVADYFGKGYFAKLCYGGVFFLRHHRALWHPLSAGLFVLCCLASLLYMVRYKALRGWWLILKTRAFLLLFLFNLTLTYLIWVLSIHWGVLDDGNLLAALLLASVCPTAASALGDLAKRFLPMDLTGVIKVIEELNAQLLDQIGKGKLDQYEVWLQQFSSEELKSKFFEVLFLELDSDSLRNRLREQLQKKIEQINQAESGDSAKSALNRIYANYLLRLLAYLSSSENDLEKRLNRVFKIQGPTPEAAV